MINFYVYNPYHPSVAFHIETSHLICSVNQMTGFYMKFNFTGLKKFKVLVKHAAKPKL